MIVVAGIERDERGYTQRRGAPARRGHARRLRPTRGSKTISTERDAGEKWAPNTCRRPRASRKARSDLIPCTRERAALCQLSQRQGPGAGTE